MPVQTRCNRCGDSSPPGLDAEGARAWLLTHTCKADPKGRARRGRLSNLDAKTPPIEGK
jgi:hypothetical protein